MARALSQLGIQILIYPGNWLFQAPDHPQFKAYRPVSVTGVPERVTDKSCHVSYHPSSYSLLLGMEWDSWTITLCLFQDSCHWVLSKLHHAMFIQNISLHQWESLVVSLQEHSCHPRTGPRLVGPFSSLLLFSTPVDIRGVIAGLPSAVDVTPSHSLC